MIAGADPPSDLGAADRRPALGSSERRRADRQLGLALAALAAGLTACAPAPTTSEGTLEAPCATGADCDSGVCLTLSGFRMCTRACNDAAHAGCPSGYGCATVEGREVCVPRLAGECRVAEDVCGPEHDPCCGGTTCVPWPDVPWRCAWTCTSSAECATACCFDAGGARVCAPPIYCDH